ncbi:MAG TPA: hypothetical protein VFL76_04695 [Edaphocola sp.]|nr:hypothetical protein [Edaphocola sp.]
MFDSPLVRKGLISALLFSVFAPNCLRAQPIGSDSGPRSNQENSPYSRYGIGNLNSPYNATLSGMGGIATAGTPGLNVNAFNPASYSFLTAATLDFAFEAKQRSVFLGDQKTNSGTGNFAYFNLGMNAGKHFGLNIGFRPIAYTYYNANDTIFNLQTMGDALNNYNGSGSLQYAFIGLAGQYKGLSIGANFGYAFGTYDYANSLQTAGSDSSGSTYHVRSAQLTNADRIGGLYWKGGLLYHAKLKKEKYFNIGATATLSQKLNVTRQNLDLAYDYLTDGTTSDLVIDTLINNEVKGKLTMPAAYTFGLAFGKAANYEIGTDFSYTDWSVFDKLGDRSGVGDNSWRVSVGGEYTPNAETPGKKYLSYVTYRLGAYYGKDYFNLFNTDVNYFGGTVGASFPLQRNYNNFGKINLSLEVGKRGSITNGLAKEVYVNFTFGISLNDTYWLKRPARYQ